jgi:hypothetical protein
MAILLADKAELNTSIIVMNSKQSTERRELVDCEICLKEIPVSEAKNEEATDYVMYFCGLECFDKWKESGGEQDQ